MTGHLERMRKTYLQGELDEATADPNPFRQFQRWLDAAAKTSLIEANSMILATVDQHDTPSARTVLLKAFDERGLVFYTNYDSRKGREIGANPAVAVVFNWPTLERQVRINGQAARVPEEDSDAYFATRPYGSQVGAAASPQSEPVPDRAWLEERFERLRQSAGPIARPAHWGGYRITPSMFEFWQGRPDRLHDRLRYDLTPIGWEIVRLAP